MNLPSIQSATNSSAAPPSCRQCCTTVHAEARVKQGPTPANIYSMSLLSTFTTAPPDSQAKLSFWVCDRQIWTFIVWFLIHTGSMLNNSIFFFFSEKSNYWFMCLTLGANSRIHFYLFSSNTAWNFIRKCCKFLYLTYSIALLGGYLESVILVAVQTH